MATANFTRSLKFHFFEAEPYYIVFIVALAAGSCAGAFTFACLSDELVKEVSVVISNYNMMLSKGIGRGDVIYEGIKSSFAFTFLLYVCSFTPTALAVGALTLAAKGFSIGFWAASAIKCFSAAQAAVLILKSVPYQLISIMSLLMMAACGAICLKKQRTTLRNTMLFLIIFAFSLIGIVCEVLIKC